MTHQTRQASAGTAAAQQAHRPATGFVQWFWQGDRDLVEQTIAAMHELGMTELRTQISWADWFTPEGRRWYEWLIPRLAGAVGMLPCVLYTPPSIAVVPRASAPPRNPRDYADFVDLMITEFGDAFEYIELWNEPNNRSEYDYTKDAYWFRFGDMIGGAAQRMRDAWFLTSDHARRGAE